MKKIIAVAVLSLTMPAFAAVSKDFFECAGIGGVEEYRVGINLKTDTAGFFDNDTTSTMRLVATRFLESIPPQTVNTYEGKDASGAGKLKLVFNLTKKRADLYSINTKGESEEIGSAPCANAEPWSTL